jgi:predicted signal transduction protein with EAL and GGDEF domain/FixJ family two-component response regulator
MSPAESSVRVLVADDDAILREIARATLEASGFAVQIVASGDAAVAACALSLPDVALLDVEMPEGDGYQACANIRMLPGGATLPIIMVTGLDDSTSIERAYEAGATDFVVKPLNWPLLAHRIRYVLRGARTIEALRVSEQKNAALLTAIPDGLLLVNSNGVIDYCFNPVAGLQDVGAARHIVDMIPKAAQSRAMECLMATLRGEPAEFEFSLQQEGCAMRHLECRYLPNASGQVLAIVRDISERKETQAHIQRLAYYDALTGLPNREWIGDYLSRSLAEAQVHNGSVALLYVDLDQFKRINDTLGHDTGDALLRQVAERLRGALAHLGAGAHAGGEDHAAGAIAAESQTHSVRGQLARVGGDEFIVVVSGQPGTMLAEQAAERILAALAMPFRQGSYELVVTPSIGIAMFPEHGSDAQNLLKNADGAMYEAKSSGRNQFRFFNDTLNVRALKRLSLEMELRRAMEDSRLEIYYQPKYETNSLTVSGGEALLRWFHPDRGQIPTADFVAVAEETGLIADIGRWALQQVCRDLASWHAQGLHIPSIAVNVSGREFMRPDILFRVSETVEQACLSPSLFELELTEGVLMRDAEAGRRSLLALKEFGFSLAMDDFGTGYCSLNYLKRFPIDTLKIDRSFVADIGTDADDSAIVRAIIALGHDLNLKIVAEGVGTVEQLRFLRTEGCDAVQGYLMSPALPARTFAALVKSAAETQRAGGVNAFDTADPVIARLSASH